MMSAENRQQISEAQAKTMASYGIAKRYHGHSFNSLGERGKPLLDLFLSGKIAQMTAQGHGLTMRSHDMVGSDLFVLTARAFMLTEVTAYVVDPQTILDARDQDYLHQQVYERAMNVPALFLKDFAQDGPSPFSASDAYRIEKMIVQRFEIGRPTYLEVFEQAKIDGWWSRRLARRMAEINQEITV